jgi:hypothetical protein
MTTKYINKVGGDLACDYDRYISGAKATVSGYKTSNGNDLSDFFAPYTNLRGDNSGYVLSNNDDISSLYQKSKWGALSTNGIAGTNGIVRAISRHNLENVYIGGDFTTAGGVTVNRIAMWNGTSWSSLTTGTSGTVNAIYAYDATHVYVGGNFATAGGVTVNRIAMWNGTSWSSLTTGTNGTVNAIYAYDATHVYVGGNFSTAGGVTSNYIAMWNGTSWSSLTSGGINGTNHIVNTIHAIDLSNVYVGGRFTRAGNVDVSNCIAVWNGTIWSSTTSAFNQAAPFVYSIYVLDLSHVYVGGDVTATYNHIAMYNGSSWSAMGAGVNGGLYSIYALDPSHVYISSLSAVSMWDETIITELKSGGSGINAYSLAICAINQNRVFAGGNFTISGTIPSNYVAMWNNGT